MEEFLKLLEQEAHKAIQESRKNRDLAAQFEGLPPHKVGYLEEENYYRGKWHAFADIINGIRNGKYQCLLEQHPETTN